MGWILGEEKVNLSAEVSGWNEMAHYKLMRVDTMQRDNWKYGAVEEIGVELPTSFLSRFGDAYPLKMCMLRDHVREEKIVMGFERRRLREEDQENCPVAVLKLVSTYLLIDSMNILQPNKGKHIRATMWNNKM